MQRGWKVIITFVVRQANKIRGTTLRLKKLAAIRLVFSFTTVRPFDHLPNLHLMLERSHSTSRLLSTNALKHWALSPYKHWRAWPAFEKFSPTLVKGFCLNSSDSYRPKYWKIKQVFITHLSEVHLLLAANHFSLQSICPYYGSPKLFPWIKLKALTTVKQSVLNLG